MNKVCIRCEKDKKISSFTVSKSKKGLNKEKRISNVCYSCHYGTQKGVEKFLWKYANTDQRKNRIKELLARRVIKKEDDCWDWNGTINMHGYGEININKKHMNASRASWIYYKGDIPEGMFVLHICDNRSCTNPDHLFLGTPKDNMQDMMKKGRANILKGDQCPWSKINEETVLKILDKIKEGLNCAEVGKIFNLKRSYISEIKLGRKWGHVGDRTGIPVVKPNERILNEENVKEIKIMIKNGSKVCQISKEFALSRSVIDDIHKGRTWKHIEI